MSEKGKPLPKDQADETDDEIIEDDAAETGEQDEDLSSDAELDDGNDLDADAGDEPSGEDDDAGKDEGQKDRQGEVKPLGRKERAVIEAKRRAKAAEEERDRLKAELETARTARPAKSAADIAAEEAAERARLELMTPDEKVAHYRQKDRQEFDQRFNNLQFQVWQGQDRAAFDARCASLPAFARIRDEAIKEQGERLRQGAIVPLETVAYYLIGKKAAESAPKAREKQQRRADARVDRQQSRATSSRSDVSRGDGRTRDERAARAKRLENVEI